MNDWEFCDGYNLQGFQKKSYNYLSKLPCVGGIARSLMFDSLAFSYDMSVNFVEAHEQASKLIQGIIQNKEFVEVILGEAKKNVLEA